MSRDVGGFRMSDNTWIVVKVGGSLFDLPDFRPRLREWLAELGNINVLIVPGGGATTDAIRAFDRTHRLGEEASHWLAIQAMSVNARFLKALLPDANLVGDVPVQENGQWYLLDALPFFQMDDSRPGHLPHRWQVTSDSLAVRAATLVNARELILLKSVDWLGNDWAEASRAGVVDEYFAQALRQAPLLHVRVVNFRAAIAPVAAP
jgi:5-(aminomethyl)-3-furanmethanol phosphate kinase